MPDINSMAQLLRQAQQELLRLRRQNEIQSAKLHVFDQMLLLFHSRPNYPTSAGEPDLSWQIDQMLQQDLEQKAGAAVEALMKEQANG